MKSKSICMRLILAGLFSCILTLTAFADAFGPGYTGWHQTDSGQWEYYVSGSKARNTWITEEGKQYYMNAEGYWVEGAAPGTGTASNGAEAVPAASGGTDISPEYAGRPNPFADTPDVVEVEIASQHVFCYKNNVLVWDSCCVTGCTADGHDTPPGVFAIQSKETARYLLGPYNAQTGKYAWKNWVDYWMPFHNGCGLHDASWRDKFAGTIYTYGGSHGCVNLPVNKAPDLFALVYVGMPVIVHQ